MPRPTHIMLHRQYYTNEWEDWLVKVQLIKEVCGPAPIGPEKGPEYGGRIEVAGYERLTGVRETPVEVAALINGD